MLYRERPKTIEAFQFMGAFTKECGVALAPSWALEAVERGVLVWRDGDLYHKLAAFEYLVHPGDYIIRGDRGDVLVYPELNFEYMYEKL